MPRLRLGDAIRNFRWGLLGAFFGTWIGILLVCTDSLDGAAKFKALYTFHAPLSNYAILLFVAIVLGVTVYKGKGP